MKIAGLINSVLLVWMGVLQVNAQSVNVLQHIENTDSCRVWVEERLSQLSLKQKVGQLFIYKVAPVMSQVYKDRVKKAVEEYGIGGLLFSGGDLTKQVQLTNYAQQLSDIPLMVTFDGEWGLAMRLKGTPSFPRNRILGCVQDDSLIYRYGKEVARQLREIGVHVNFAPVADVDNNPKNPVINTRSFGSDKENVARKVVAYSRGLEDGGVLAVCKHFPGHGDTDVDSHLALPVLTFNRERLDSLELYPFKKAIASGVGGMMVGHLHVSCMDNRPASVSQAVVERLLRNELFFSGLVFTDALEMKGITQGFSDASAQALIAGNDLLLPSANLKQELDGVMKAIRSGKLSEADITEKCRKVLTYKYALGLSKYRPAALEGISRRIKTEATSRLMDDLDKAAVTVLKDSANALPLDMSLSDNVLLSLSSSLSETHPFYQELRKVYPTLSWVHGTAQALAEARRKMNQAQQVIVAVDQKSLGGYASLIAEMAAHKPVVVVCFQPQKLVGNELLHLQDASAVVLAHSDKAVVQRYVAGVLLGRERADGRLSVGIGTRWPVGTGVTVLPVALKRYSPEEMGMNSEVLKKIDAIAEEGISKKAYPGCQVLIMRKGHPVYNKSFGKFTYDGKTPVTSGSVYDLASLSKAAGTLLAVMKLYDEGRIGLTDKISKYLPQLQHSNKADITIQELLYHESGIPAYWPFYREAVSLDQCPGGLFSRRRDAQHTIRVGASSYACSKIPYKKEWVSKKKEGKYTLQLADGLFLRNDFKKVIVDKIAELPLKPKVYRYSCLNFMLLKEMVESVSGSPMDQYLANHFYLPMGLNQTRYCPLSSIPVENIVPSVASDFLRGGEVRGRVHDEAAAFMGGVSGNAGLFSTAGEVGAVFQMLLDGGSYGGKRYLSRATCDIFLTMKSKHSRRGLGFDKPDMRNPDHSPCAKESPASVFGHTGFTGTCAWADPENELVFVFLSNRIYPQVYGSTNLMKLDIRTRIQQTMYQAIRE